MMRNLPSLLVKTRIRIETGPTYLYYCNSDLPVVILVAFLKTCANALLTNVTVSVLSSSKLPPFF